MHVLPMIALIFGLSTTPPPNAMVVNVSQSGTFAEWSGSALAGSPDALVVRKPDGPDTLFLVVENGSTLQSVWAAVSAAREAGFSHVRYFGCVPPGCGVLTGATPNQLALNGRVVDIEWLFQVLAENSEKC